MYNSIYPVNINYRNNNRYQQQQQNAGKDNVALNPDEQNRNPKQSTNTDTFPNGTKVAIDYTKGQINISQVITDFKNTIIAINAPDDVKDEVNAYLLMTEKESLKESPSKEIIVANLKNASRVSDDFIARTLGKKSNVVAGWIDALFLQKVNIKADPNEINPDFLLEFPKKAQERIEKENPSTKHFQQDEQPIQPTDYNTFVNPAAEIEPSIVQATDSEPLNEPFTYSETETSGLRIIQPEEQTTTTQIDPSSEISILQPQAENIEIANTFELSSAETNNTPLDAQIQGSTPIPASPFNPVSEADKAARNLFIKAKNTTNDNSGDTQSLNLLNEALGILAADENPNQNIKAAIHLERGKIFDNYDYVDYALRDYWEATKATDLNLKANAYYKTGSIYDEFSEFSPALNNYLSSVAYSGEADNPKAQAQALTKIAGLYSKQYDLDNFSQYSDLAIESALDTESDDLIAKTYSTSAQNYQYLGENDRAIDSYKNALEAFSRKDESYEQMAYNYEQAALVMEKLGNSAKAAKLQAKANLYYQKAQLQPALLKAVS